MSTFLSSMRTKDPSHGHADRLAQRTTVHGGGNATHVQPARGGGVQVRVNGQQISPLNFEGTRPTRSNTNEQTTLNRDGYPVRTQSGGRRGENLRVNGREVTLGHPQINRTRSNDHGQARIGRTDDKLRAQYSGRRESHTWINGREVDNGQMPYSHAESAQWTRSNGREVLQTTDHMTGTTRTFVNGQETPREKEQAGATRRTASNTREAPQPIDHVGSGNYAPTPTRWFNPSRGPDYRVPLPPHADRNLNPERQLSSRETIFPSPDAPRALFAEERRRRDPNWQAACEAIRQRPGTPYRARVSIPHHRPRSSQSDRSARVRTPHFETDDEEDYDYRSDEATVGPLHGYQPHFGSSRGIGEGTSAYEVVGLGRKKPRHRDYHADLLKPAMRPYPSPKFGGWPNSTGLSANYNKPLPVPQSLPHNRPTNPVPSRRARTTHSISNLRSLFSNVPLNPATIGQTRSSKGIPDPPRLTRSRHSKPDWISPAEDLYTYLRVADIPAWTSWPDPDSRKPASHVLRLAFSNDLFSSRQKGFSDMPEEWFKRLEAADLQRHAGRALRSWQSAGEGWETRTMEWIEDHIPTTPVHKSSRWGNQIFAVRAEGFKTGETSDDSISTANDNGLLVWFSGTILHTILSVLNMLRHSSQSFRFRVLPSPHLSQNSHNVNRHGTPAFHDGIGTLVLMNKADELDRTMILEVRPPSILDSAVMKEFARHGRSEPWYQMEGRYCIGDKGQANLLQAQVYDSCVVNQARFFVVTNVKEWVFGHFSMDYTKCFVSPVIERRQHDPSVMQCLAAWTMRSVDEHPRGGASPSAGFNEIQRAFFGNPSDAISREIARPRRLSQNLRRHANRSSRNLANVSTKATYGGDGATYAEARRPRPLLRMRINGYTLPPDYYEVAMRRDQPGLFPGWVPPMLPLPPPPYGQIGWVPNW